MLEKNSLPMSTMSESSVDEISLPVKTKSDIASESDGSVWSHLMFGFGSLLFVSPMMIPGIPLGWLAVVYSGLLGVAILGFMLWSAFNALKARQQRR